MIGKSDEQAAFPDGPAYLPSDLAATVYTALGVDTGLDVVHADKIDAYNDFLDLIGSNQ